MTDDFTSRLDRAAQEGTRPILGRDSSPQDIAKAFRVHEILAPQPVPTEPVRAEVIRWYVVKTNPKCEGKAETGLRETGILSYVPKLKVWRRVRRPKPGKPQKRAVEQALFPGYVFAGFAEACGEDFGLAREVDGVHSFIAVQGHPLRVPASEMEKIRTEEEAGFYDKTRERPPKVIRGQAVVIGQGPLAGMRGHVSQLKSGERVKVLLSILGAVSAVTLGIDQVEGA